MGDGTGEAATLAVAAAAVAVVGVVGFGHGGDGGGCDAVVGFPIAASRLVVCPSWIRYLLSRCGGGR